MAQNITVSSDNLPTNKIGKISLKNRLDIKSVRNIWSILQKATTISIDSTSEHVEIESNHGGSKKKHIITWDRFEDILREISTGLEKYDGIYEIVESLGFYENTIIYTKK